MRALNLFTLLYRWLVTTIAPSAAAQVYRSKPLRMIVPQGAGGSTDSLTRSLAKAMSDALQQLVIVENRDGAGGILCVDVAAKAPTDGDALPFGSNTTMAARPENIYRHRWRTHGLTAWDNRSLMHKALRDRVPGTHRHMHRTTVLGAPSGELYQGDRRIATRNQRKQACDQSSKPCWPA